MSDNTKIEWADATVNAVNGCAPISPGCTNCYAMKQAHRFPARAGLTVKSKGGMVWTGEVRLNETALMQPLKWKRGRKIFWNAHGDLFHENVPDEWIDRVFAICALTRQHTHMILTKRSARMRAYVNGFGCDGSRRFHVLDAAAKLSRGWAESARGLWALEQWPLPNVWLGVSVEDQARADERIPDLLATPAAVRFLSCEPLLGPVDLAQLQEGLSANTWLTWLDGLDWVIVGGESGPGARPMHPDWARSLRDQCAAAGVPFFFKQWGEWVALAGPDGFWPHNTPGACRLMIDGERHPRGLSMQRLGKKRAGRLLDGVEHSEFPGV